VDRGLSDRQYINAQIQERIIGIGNS
jgi:hypothetical protein